MLFLYKLDLSSEIDSGFLKPPIMKSVLNKCQVCLDQTSQRYHVPDNPNLPEFRLDSKHPGKTTFLDKTNHYFIKDKHCNTRKGLFNSLCVCFGGARPHWNGRKLSRRGFFLFIGKLLF